MLVLSRRKNEKLMIGDDIIVTVNEIRGNKIKLGIEAPRGTRILRYELLVEIADPTPPEEASHEHCNR